MSIDTRSIKDAIVNFLIPIIAVAATLGMLFLVIYPSITSYGELNTELEENRDLEQQLYIKLTTLNKLIDFKDLVGETSTLVTQVLVDDPMVPELLTQIDIIARDSGLEVVKLSYSFGAGENLEESMSKSIRVLLGARGNYDQIRTFLSNLEGASRLVKTRSVRFSLGTDKDSNIYEVTYVLESPYMKVNSSAVTDAPVDVDITEDEFVKTMEWIKSLRYYDVQVPEEFLEVEETPAEEEGEPETVEESPFAQPPPEESTSEEVPAEESPTEEGSAETTEPPAE